MNKLSNQRAIALGLGLASMIAFGACDIGGNNGGNQGPAAPGSQGQFDRFDRNGPNGVNQVRTGICTQFRPQGVNNPRSGLGWANGTGGTPGTYSGILTRTASHGAFVTAANTTQSGSGQETSTCINQTNLNIPFTAAGHSQGGSGSINASRLNGRVVNTCPVQLDGRFTARSNPADIKGTNAAPAVIQCGGGDTLAPCGPANNGDTKFEQSRVCRSQITIPGNSHFVPTGGGGDYAAIVAACAAAAGGDAAAAGLLRAPQGVENWQTRTAGCN